MPRIFDCFPFFNELDLLEIRLNELADLVDFFVLVEATHSHQGKPKPLHYRDNAGRFAQFKEKIRHVIVDDLPEAADDGRGAAWSHEGYQRNCILRGLQDFAEPHDLVMVGDADEIASRGFVENIWQHERFASESTLYLNQQLHFYYLDCLGNVPGWWYRHFLTTAGRIEKVTPQGAWIAERSGAHRAISEGCGWHFTFFGGPQAVRDKLEAYAHTENDREEFKDLKAIERRMLNAEDPLGRPLQHSFAAGVPLPEYVLRNRAKYEQMGWFRLAGISSTEA